MDLECKVYLELGTFTGASAVMAMQRWPEASIVCVDSWCGEAMEGSPFVDAVANSLDYCQGVLFPWRERIALVRMRTKAGLREVRLAGIQPDVIFVDADHSYIPSYQDIATSLAYWPNAIVCGDDYPEPCGHAAAQIAVERRRTLWTEGRFWAMTK